MNAGPSCVFGPLFGPPLPCPQPVFVIVLPPQPMRTECAKLWYRIDEWRHVAVLEFGE